MPCEKCSDGVWACSIDDEPCGNFNDPTDTQQHCLQMLTKKVAGSCMMDIRLAAPGEDPPPGWDDAGKLCFTFQLFENQNGYCVVKVEGPTTS